MPADPPRVLDDAVAADARIIAAQTAAYAALAGDMNEGDAQTRSQRAKVARRQWATLALAVANNDGAKAVLLQAGAYACTDVRALSDDEQDAQHELLQGALSRVHLGDALDPNLSAYVGTVYLWMSLYRVRLVRVLGDMSTQAASAAAAGAPIPYTLDAIVGKAMSPVRLASFLGSQFRKDVQTIISDPTKTLADLTAKAAPDDTLSEEQIS